MPHGEQLAVRPGAEVPHPGSARVTSFLEEVERSKKAYMYLDQSNVLEALLDNYSSYSWTALVKYCLQFAEVN